MIDMSRLAPTGWSRLDGLGKSPSEDFAKQREAMLAEAEVLAAPFLTPAGQKCLELLIAKTFDRPLVRLPVEAASVEHQALYAAQRQGQNDIVGMIRTALARVGSGQPEVAHETDLAATVEKPGRSGGRRRRRSG